MKIAIIGASYGQKVLYEKAKAFGIYSIGFAWKEGAICDRLADKFYPISITEIDEIVAICKQEKVDGVVSNASEFTATIASIIAERLHLIGNPYDILLKIKDKYTCRCLTKDVPDLTPVRSYLYDDVTVPNFPCIIKPVQGGGKKGVSFVATKDEFLDGIAYARSASDQKIVIEEYIDGREISVESISFKGKHYPIQITDKVNSGYPHFVELAHHQPSTLNENIQDRIKKMIPLILDSVGFVNGASHIEMRIDKDNKIYLIEINPRGGGDEISNQLVYLSTGYDYVKAMIDVALGTFRPSIVKSVHCSGIYFLCAQSAELVEFFKQADKEPWLKDKVVHSDVLNVSTGNRDRNGYIVYQWNEKIIPNT